MKVATKFFEGDIMKIIIRILFYGPLILLILIMGYITFVPKVAYYMSPNNSFTLKIDYSGAYLYLEVFNDKDDLEYSDNTLMSSRHGFYVKWYGDERFVVNSTDIGPTEWVRNKSGKWITKDPLTTKSPNEKLSVFSYYWFPHQYIAIDIRNADGEMIFNDKTRIIVSDLVDCIEWKSNERFIIKGDEGNFTYKKYDNGQWQMIK